MSCSATPSRGPRRSRVHCPQSMAVEEIYHRLNGFSKKMMLVERRRGACLLCQETELPAIVLRYSDQLFLHVCSNTEFLAEFADNL